jgi:hypothetical protein
MDQLPSIEGVFIALETYIQRHWPTYDWFALWYGGMPFTRVYQPGLHYSTAAFSSIAGVSIASAYHILIAITYSLGGVTFYLLARALTRSTATALLGGLIFSLTSPSLFLIPVVRYDAGGLWRPRRLQALIPYGEGPNVTGLTLAMLALAAVHYALTRKTALTTCLAGFAVALVPIFSWPATLAFVMALACYVIALSAQDLLPALGRLLLIGVLAFGFAAPSAPPSTILGTLAQANVMDDGPTPGPSRWIALGLMVVAVAALRAALAWARTGFELRFPLIWFLLTGWIVLASSFAGIRVIPYPGRFHLAMEIPLIVVGAICAMGIVARWPVLQKPALAVLLIFCAIQTYNYRRFAHAMIHPLKMQETSQYRMARWADAHMAGQRIFTRGTFAYWLNAFTETPQMGGFFDQSISNNEDRIASYVVSAGFETNPQSADISLLWLKAWAADAIHIGGPKTVDFYRDYSFPDRFRNTLPVVWSIGDDAIYRVPERTEGLARVVRAADLMKHKPVNGIDLAELRPFVAALDDPSLPQARFAWQGANAAHISGTLAPGQVYSVAINYDPGWTATHDGKPVPLHADGMGIIALEPGCNGPCDIDLHWSQRWEPPFVITAFLLALAGSAAWCGIAWCGLTRRN